jgi:hypothetical protein
MTRIHGPDVPSKQTSNLITLREQVVRQSLYAQSAFISLHTSGITKEDSVPLMPADTVHVASRH